VVELSLGPSPASCTPSGHLFGSSRRSPNFYEESSSDANVTSPRAIVSETKVWQLTVLPSADVCCCSNLT
jgi:hypothetical protein